MNEVILTTPELKPGDIIVTHGGMRVLIDGPMLTAGARCGTFYRRGLVLNRDEVPGNIVPLGWTREQDGTDRWTIQGNELAHWYVERETVA